MTNSIYPCLWFDGQAKEAADLYCYVFENSVIRNHTPLVVNFELGGQKFMGLNGGPKFKPNASVSFFVSCKTSEEVEDAYLKLIEDGSALMPLDKYPWSEKYGWIQDKFGVNWQLFFDQTKLSFQKFSSCLMFTGTQAGRAEEAMNFYASVFENSSVVGIARYEAGEQDVEGTVKHGIFSLDGNSFRAMDSSMPHEFSFNEGISFVVDCETQKEIDYFWEELTKGGAESRCGWLKDRFGVSWQIVPKILGDLMSDPEKSPRVAAAFMQMKKFDIEKLKRA